MQKIVVGDEMAVYEFALPGRRQHVRLILPPDLVRDEALRLGIILLTLCADVSADELGMLTGIDLAGGIDAMTGDTF